MLYIANSAGNPLIYGDFSNKRIGINTTNLSKTFNVSGDADISGTLSAGALTGPLNGASFGRIYLNQTSGIVVSIAGGVCDIYWNYTAKTITLRNTSPTNYCFARILKMPLGTTGLSHESTGLVNGTKLLVTFASNGDACEISFGDESGNGTCTVWLQYVNSIITGHYVKY